MIYRKVNSLAHTHSHFRSCPEFAPQKSFTTNAFRAASIHQNHSLLLLCIAILLSASFELVKHINNNNSTELNESHGVCIQREQRAAYQC